MIEEVKKIDPTLNVKELVNLEVDRLDDLRGAETRRVNEISSNNKEHFKEISELRAVYDEKLREEETKRIDAIRLVDTQAVSTANDKAIQQAAGLATQVATSAEVLRKLVADTAASTATQLTQIITPITDRISLLEKNQYQGVGAQGQFVTQTDLSVVVDKINNSFETALKPVVAFMNAQQGKSQGIGTSWMTFVQIAGIAIVLGKLFKVI